MGPFFSRKILFFSGALGLGLTCLGLEPALPIIHFYLIYIIGIVLLLLVFSFNISLSPLTSKSKNTLTFRSNLSLTVSPLTPLLSKPTIYFFSLRCRHHFFFFFAQITSPLTVRLPLPLFKSQAATSIHLHK